MRFVTISSIYGENLSILKKPLKQNTPLFLRIKTDTRQYTTKLDSSNNQSKHNGNNIGLELPLHVNFVTLEIHAGRNSNNKLVGTVTVPVSDMVGQVPAGHHVRFLSYRLRDVRGDKNGIINFCAETMKAACSSAPAGYGGGGCAVSRTEWGVPACEEKFAGGVVTGIPIWYHMHQVKC